MNATIPSKLVDKVLKDLRAKSAEAGCDFKLVHHEEFLEGDVSSEASAWFTVEPDLQIRVSTKNRSTCEWLLNALHEDSHLDQWEEDAKVWKDCFIDGVDITHLADLWMHHHIELSPSQRKRIFNALYEFERDAEVRAVKKIIDTGIVEYIDLGRHIQECWAYILEYKLQSYSRTTISAKDRPYKIEEIVAAQPKNFKTKHGCIGVFMKYYPEMNQPLIRAG